ncbi:MAG: flavin reductase family protein [Ruminococcus sp.]
MNRKALQKLSYGVYLVTTANGNQLAGCVANSAMQITSAPAQIAVSLNHDNATHDAVAQAGKFAVAVLPTDVEPSLIGGFGYRSGRDINKFARNPVPDAGTACRFREWQWRGSPVKWYRPWIPARTPSFWGKCWIAM